MMDGPMLVAVLWLSMVVAQLIPDPVRRRIYSVGCVLLLAAVLVMQVR